MAGAGNVGETTVQIETQEAALGTVKVVWLPQFGSLHVPVAPGTADGAVIWVQSALGGPVAVTIRVGKVRHRLSAKQQILAYGTAVVLVAGGCTGAGLLAFRDRGTKAATTHGATAHTDSDTVSPVSAGQYAALLAAADSAIGTGFRRLGSDPKALGAGASPAAQTIHDQVTKLRAVRPPAAVASTNGSLTDDLDGLANMIAQGGAAVDQPHCPAAATSPYVSVLASEWATRIHAESQALAKADPAYAFGKFLPVAPRIVTTRPTTGSFVKKASQHGTGKLKIKNAGADSTISLVPTKGAKKPVFTVYVRGKGSYTVTRVPAGTYWLYYTSGNGWNPARKGFTDNCDFSKFDDTFRFSGYPIIDSWAVTMTPSIAGNASTSDVDPNAFPSE